MLAQHGQSLGECLVFVVIVFANQFHLKFVDEDAPEDANNFFYLLLAHLLVFY